MPGTATDPAAPKLVAGVVRELDLDPAVAVRMLANRVATSRGLPEPWDTPPAPQGLPALAGIAEVGAVHQLLLGGQAEQRGRQGSYYTPDAVAQWVTQFTLDVQATRLGRHPMDVLVLDPACGAGAYLIQAARQLTVRLIQLELAREPTEELMRGLLPHLAYDCVFGIDIDPVAVDLAKTALWLETDASVPVTWLDRNIIVGNALADDEPPRLIERRAPSDVNQAVPELGGEYPEVRHA